MSIKLSPKYRPYLSLTEMQYIVSLLEGKDDLDAHTIRASLNILILKASVGIATGSYQPTKRKTVVDSLGFNYDSVEEARYLNGEMTPDEEIAYQNSIMKTSSI